MEERLSGIEHTIKGITSVKDRIVEQHLQLNERIKQDVHPGLSQVNAVQLQKRGDLYQKGRVSMLSPFLPSSIRTVPNCHK